VKRKQTWERKRRSCSDVESVMVDPCSAVSNLFLLLCICVCFSGFLSSASSSVPLQRVPALPSSLLQILYAKKMKPRPTGSPCWFMVSLLFSSFFLFFLFYCQSSQPHSNTGEWKKLSLFSAFFSPTVCLSFVLFFLVFLFARFSCPFFFFSPPISRSLEGLIYSLTYLYLGKI